MRSKSLAASRPTNRTAAQSLGGAVAWMGLALLCFSAIAISGREAAHFFPTNELIFWRSVVGVASLVLVGSVLGEPASRFASPVLQIHVGRATIHYAAQYAWLYALTLIPLAELFALEFTAPLWVALLAPAILGERLTIGRLASAAVGFAGAMLVAEPALLHGEFRLTASTGTVLAAASAIGFAGSMIVTKRLTRTEPALRILFWMQVLQGIFALMFIVATALYTNRLPMTLSGSASLMSWACIVVLGIAGVGAHFGLTRAFGLADAIIVAPLDFLRLPLIALVGALFYNEKLTLGVAVGAALVVFANFLNVTLERRMARRT